MNRVRKYRKQIRMKQAELADAVGYSQATIGHYESGRRKPSLEDSRAVTAALRAAGATEDGHPVTLDDVFPPVAAEAPPIRKVA